MTALDPELSATGSAINYARLGLNSRIRFGSRDEIKQAAESTVELSLANGLLLGFKFIAEFGIRLLEKCRRPAASNNLALHFFRMPRPLAQGASGTLLLQ